MEIDLTDFEDISDDRDHFLPLDFSQSSTSDEEELEEIIEVDFVDDDSVIIEEENQLHFGGYEHEFVDEVSPNQKCPVCLLPMRDAVQTSLCGHRFCRDCLHGILRTDHAVCPNDRQEISEESGYFTDKAWARDILSLRVKCQQNARGCDWIGELRHSEEHQDDCPYEDAQCSGCQDSIQRRLLETHLNEECPKRIVECVHCQDEFFFVQKQMSSHVSEKCPMTVVSCPYLSAGCPYQDKRAHLKDHLEASVDDHLEMTWCSLVETKQELDSMRDLRQKFHKVDEVNQKMVESNARCRVEIKDLSVAVKNLKMENTQQNKSIEDLSLELRHLEMKNTQLKKVIEDLSKKTTKEIKSVESRVLRYTQVRASGDQHLRSYEVVKPSVTSRLLSKSYTGPATISYDTA